MLLVKAAPDCSGVLVRAKPEYVIDESLLFLCIKMLPIATVQGVKDEISTGMIIDLSEYLKKTEGVTKSEFATLETTVSGKLDTEPQHKHDISDVKNLHEALDGKYDTSKKYPHNVILSDTDKISYIEAPKVQRLEVAMNSTVEGYNFYVDDANGDLMILSPSSVLIATYSLAGNSWTFGGVSLNEIANNSTIAEHEELIRANSVDIVSNTAKITAVQDAVNTHTHTAFNNDVTVGGTLTVKKIAGSGDVLQLLVGDKVYLAFANDTVQTLRNISTQGDLSVKGTNILSKITELETGIQSNTDSIKNNSGALSDLYSFVSERINELYEHKSKTDAILKNHYDALMLLLEKHDMVDSNTGDGSNVTPA